MLIYQVNEDQFAYRVRDFSIKRRHVFLESAPSIQHPDPVGWELRHIHRSTEEDLSVILHRPHFLKYPFLTIAY